MEVIRSIEVHHKREKSLAETLLYIETNARKEKHYWSTIAPSPSISDFVFLHHSGALAREARQRSTMGKKIW